MPTLSRIATAADHHAVNDDQHDRTEPASTSSHHKRKIATDANDEYLVVPPRKRNGGFDENKNPADKNYDGDGIEIWDNHEGVGNDDILDLDYLTPASNLAAGGHAIIQHAHSHHHNTLTTTPPYSSSQFSSTTSPPPPSSIPFTRVDGKGLWRSWKRNFKNKLLALLDLIDNSLDASIVTTTTSPENEVNETSSLNEKSLFIGRIHIYPDDYEEQDLRPTTVSSSSPFFATGATAATTTNKNNNNNNNTRGLCIINNSFHPIRPLVRVLEVYNSSKVHSGAHDIGENGVGLKQGCATLSDLSFVLVKNEEEGFVELGIVAESLQMPEGCYLPSFRFDLPDDVEVDIAIESIKCEIMILFRKPEHSNVARCVEQYGSRSRNAATNSVGHLFERGVDRLCKHFRSILNFFDNPFVFAVILDNVTYGDRHYSKNGTSSQSADPIKDLRSEIPRTYLHIPAGFDFRIGNSNMNREKLIFDYWPQRLVELSSFSVHVNENVPWHHGDDEVHGYKLRVFAGFDRMRINSFDEVKSASMYVYSRQSGRLIKYEPDARFLLGLNASGSMYCSGLTIIVDDIHGKLPLNPTKQDIAFGEQANGDVHKDNMYTWVGAVTKFFYDHHLLKFSQKKADLTQKIKVFGSDLTASRMKEIDRCQLTQFNIQYTFYGEKSIRIKRNPKELVGRDTHFLLVPDAPPERVSSDEDASSRRIIDQALQMSQQQQGHTLHAQGGIISSTAVLPVSRQSMANQERRESNRGLNKFVPVAFPHQAVVPVNNRSGGNISHSAITAGPAVLVSSSNSTLNQKEHEFQACMNRHRDDVLRLIRECAAKGESSVPISKMTAARNKNLLHMRAANLSVRQHGGTMLMETDLKRVMANAEQDAIALHKQQELRQANAPVEKLSGGTSKQNGENHEFSDVDDDNCSVSSSKSYYKDLCTRLTTTLEKRNDVNHELRKEITNLKEALGKTITTNNGLRSEITNLKEALGKRNSASYESRSEVANLQAEVDGLRKFIKQTGWTIVE